LHSPGRQSSKAIQSHPWRWQVASNAMENQKIPELNGGFNGKSINHWWFSHGFSTKVSPPAHGFHEIRGFSGGS